MTNELDQHDDINQGGAIRAHRRAKLQQMITDSKKSRAGFARANGVGVQSIANYLNVDLPTFGDRAARSLEEKLGLPEYFFDEDFPGFVRPIPVPKALTLVHSGEGEVVDRSVFKFAQLLTKITGLKEEQLDVITAYVDTVLNRAEETATTGLTSQ